MRLHLDSSTGIGGAGQVGGAGGTQALGGGLKAGRESDAGAKDSVGLSGASAALSQSASVRAARLQQLSAAVQGGTYSVAGSAIAGALVRQSIA